MANVLAPIARMSTATTGTGTVTLGSAVTGFLTFAEAGITDGQVVSYAIEEGANREVGYGTYTASGTTLSRTVVKSTNSNALVNLSGSAQIFISPLPTDIAPRVIGSIIDWPMATPPSFALSCDGAAANRTTYARLYEILGTAYGVGDGVAVTGAANNGAGLIRITATAHGLTTSDVVGINGVVGTTEANGSWTVTVIDANNVDLQGSTFANTYTSGGNIGTTFNIPDRRGEAVRGWANGSANDPDRASRTNRGDGTGGDVVGSKQGFALENITGYISGSNDRRVFGAMSGAFEAQGSNQAAVGIGTVGAAPGDVSFDASRVATTSTETRMRNVSTNFCIVFE